MLAGLGQMPNPEKQRLFHRCYTGVSTITRVGADRLYLVPEIKQNPEKN